MTLSQAEKAIENGRVTDAVIRAYDYYMGDGAYEQFFGEPQKTGRSPKFEAVVSQIQGMEDRTGGINQITTTVINANRQGLITDAEAKEILGWYGIKA